MISEPERRHIVTLIREARDNGSRLAPACRKIGVSARTLQRWTQNGGVAGDRRPKAIRPVPANKMTPEETQRILEVCHQLEFASLPPGQIIPRLADQGRFLASESTFYRALREAGEQNHRGRSRKPRKHTPPDGFCATGPNQVWTWDITWLKAPVRGMFFYLYMIVDVFSRKIVGWEVFDRECSELAAGFVHKAVLAEGCVLKPLVLHSDNGSPQKGFTLKAKMETLGIMASFSRPRVSNDNPFSESLFRTCKYRPDYPEHCFQSLDESRLWVRGFVRWYNHEHRHSGIRFVTPHQRHTGQDRDILARRKALYEETKEKCSARWSGPVRNWSYIDQVWLNPPKGKMEQDQAA